MVKRNKADPGARYVVREASTRDLDDLFELSRHLNSVNLPNDKKALKDTIARSKESFTGRIEDAFRREYLFVLEEISGGKLSGTSMLFAQHGHSDAPHIYFDVYRDERYSITLNKHFSHECLRLGFNYRGPTEIGGLVLDPSLRGYGLGKQLSFARFLFIAMYRDRFRPTVIAELMPPLTQDGRSELWDHLGRKFTDLDYQEADKLSRENKEFITALFPHNPIIATLLPKHVQELIGQVGEESKSVKRMLESIGFEYSERIDPFDGGPHFEAPTDQIDLVKNARNSEVEGQMVNDDLEVVRVLVGVGEREGHCKFRAAESRARLVGDRIQLPEEIKDLLRVRPGDRVWTIPLQ